MCAKAIRCQSRNKIKSFFGDQIPSSFPAKSTPASPGRTKNRTNQIRIVSKLSAQAFSVKSNLKQHLLPPSQSTLKLYANLRSRYVICIRSCLIYPHNHNHSHNISISISISISITITITSQIITCTLQSPSVLFEKGMYTLIYTYIYLYYTHI